MPGIARVLVAAALLWLAAAAAADAANAPMHRLPPRPPHAHYLVVVAQQRSGSSHVTAVLAQHPCVLQGNEALGTGKREQDSLGLHALTNLSQEQLNADPGAFLDAAHPLACAGLPHECGGRCTIVLKLFELHIGGLWEAQRAVLAHSSVRVAVLERDPAAKFCSLQHARETGDWGITPTGHLEWGHGAADIAARRAACLESLEANAEYEQYKAQHAAWFGRARGALAALGKPHVEVPFEASVRGCTWYTQVLPMLLLHAGQDPALAAVADADVRRERACR